VTGRDAAAGLVTILKRGIPASDVLRVCRTVWIRTFQRRRPDLVAAWLEPRIGQVSGVTLREAVKLLPPETAARLLAAYRARHQARAAGRT